MTYSPTLSRRTTLKAAGAVALATISGPGAFAQGTAGPLDLTRLVVGSPAGSVLDVFARRLADSIQPAFARNAIVENRTGASGQIAVNTVKSAPADGTTVLVTPMPMMGIFPHTYRRLAYNPVSDFMPVAIGAVFDLAFAVGPAVPANVRSLADFFAWCKANPARAHFGSPAAGSTPHFVGSMAARAAGVEITHIPYRGPTPAIMDMVGGQLSAACSTIGDFMPFIESGKARVLATTGATRNRFARDVATFAEQGFKDIVLNDWFGLFLPAGTPVVRVQRLSASLKTALASPVVVRALSEKGLEAHWSSPAELQSRLQADLSKWGPIVKSFNFTAES